MIAPSQAIAGVSDTRINSSVSTKPHSSGPDCHLRIATIDDLDSINSLVTAAMRTWALSERVLRLSLPLYHYEQQDFETQRLLLAENDDGTVIGMAAIESSNAVDSLSAKNPALLHGIYVDPTWHRSGIGSELLACAENCARSAGHDGMLVRANPGAVGFFEAMGFERLPVSDTRQDYAHRYWKTW